MSTDPRKNSILATAVSTNQPIPMRQGANEQFIDTAQTAPMMMQLVDDENDDNGDRGDFWKKIAFYIGLAAATLIVFWYFALQDDTDTIQSWNNKNGPDFMKAVKTLQSRGKGPMSTQQEQARQSRSTGYEGETAAIGIGATIKTNQLFSLLQTVIVVVCSMALAPAVNYKFFKLLALVTFIGIALSFLTSTVLKTMGIISYFKIVTAYNLIKDYNSDGPVIEGVQLPDLIVSFVQLVVIACLFLTLLLTGIFGLLAYMSDFTTPYNGIGHGQSGGPSSMPTPYVAHPPSAMTALMPSVTGQQCRPTMQSAQGPATYDRLAFG